jgi:hypothetical protein
MQARFLLKIASEKVKAQLKHQVRQNVMKAGLHFRNELVKTVDNEGNGRKYPVPGTGRIEQFEIISKLGRKQKVRRRVHATMHRTSAPGEPQVVLFGQLKTHMAVEFIEEGSRFIARVGPHGVPYAKRLEFGFNAKDSLGKAYNMAPRPFFMKTYMEQKETLIRILRGEQP